MARLCRLCHYDLTGIASIRCPECGAAVGLNASNRPTSVKAVAIWIGLGTLVELIALFLAFASAGMGHGDYGFARLLFPCSMLLSMVTEGKIIVPWIALAVMQYPCMVLHWA